MSEISGEFIVCDAFVTANPLRMVTLSLVSHGPVGQVPLGARVRITILPDDELARYSEHHMIHGVLISGRRAASSEGWCWYCGAHHEQVTTKRTPCCGDCWFNTPPGVPDDRDIER